MENIAISKLNHLLNDIKDIKTDASISVFLIKFFHLVEDIVENKTAHYFIELFSKKNTELMLKFIQLISHRNFGKISKKWYIMKPNFWSIVYINNKDINKFKIDMENIINDLLQKKEIDLTKIFVFLEEFEEFI